MRGELYMCVSGENRSPEYTRVSNLILDTGWAALSARIQLDTSTLHDQGVILGDDGSTPLVTQTGLSGSQVAAPGDWTSFTTIDYGVAIDLPGYEAFMIGLGLSPSRRTQITYVRFNGRGFTGTSPSNVREAVLLSDRTVTDIANARTIFPEFNIFTGDNVLMIWLWFFGDAIVDLQQPFEDLVVL